jgi:hypothetical protein
MVLGEYGGDTEMARKKYKDLLYAELSKDIDIKDKIIGQSLIGRSEFIEWVKEKFIDKNIRSEIPAVKEIHCYNSVEGIMVAIKKVTGKSPDDLKEEKGVYRQIVMDLLYRFGGLKGEEIGKIFGVGYTSVSQERRRLAKKAQRDRKLCELIIRIEGLCQ